MTAESTLSKPVRKKAGWLNVLVHLGAIFPLAWLAWDAYAGNLSVNPIQDLTLRTGKTALVLLVLSLACSPANLLFGFRQALKLRRPLGLYAFGYATIHLFIFIGVDYGFNFGLAWKDTFEKRYIWAGASALLLLLPLAVTSFNWWMKRLGKNWKRLHRLVYAAGALAVVHFAWVVKGNITTLQGDIAEPLIFGLLLTALLVLRLPPVRRWVKSLNQTVSADRREV